MNRRALIPLILLLILIPSVFAIWFFFFRSSGSSLPSEVRLTYWGLFEPPEVMNELIADYVTEFQQKNPKTTLTITYERKFFETLEQYRELLLNRLVSGQGPDIFRAHSSWVPQFAAEMTPAPIETLSAEQFANTFYSVARQSCVIQNQVYAAPIMYEGLALVANVDLFQKAGLAIPQADESLTWLQFAELSQALTKRAGGQLTQAGAAIGTGANIPHSSDLVGLMLAQVDITSLSTLEANQASAATVFDFYGSFLNEERVWDTTYSSSIDAFINGKVAMIFVPTWRILDIQELNPGIQLQVIPVPQTPSPTKKMAQWSSFWVEGVSRDSAQSAIAWDFLRFLTTQETQKKFYSRATSFRPFGEIYSRPDLSPSLVSHAILGPVVRGAPDAHSWFIADFSGNKPYVDLVKQALDQVGQGADGAAAVKTLTANMKQLAGQNKAVPAQ